MSGPAEASDFMSTRGLLRDTTRTVLRTVEWTGLCYQTSTLIWTVSVDPYPTLNKVIVALLIPGHVALLPAYVRGKGPFSRGGWWVPVAITAAFGVHGLVAILSYPNSYGNPWIYVSNYSASTFALIACYPWRPGGSAGRRIVVDCLLFVAFYSYLLTLTALNNDSPVVDQAKTAGAAMLWPAVGYVIGKSVEQVSIVFTVRQLEQQRHNFTEFFHFLHSNVKAGIAAVRADLPAAEVRAQERLRELDSAVSDYRVRLVLAHEQVPAAELFSERIRTFASVIKILETPRMGALTVPRAIGVILNRALGDLLTNTVVHGATAVQVGFEYDRHRVTLTIADDGPGFPATILDDETTSLHRLREAARGMQGDLRKAAVPLGGTAMELTIPFKESRKKR